MMKPHPRIRKTIKWGGAVVTVLLVVAWVGSGWFFVSCTFGRPITETSGRLRSVHIVNGVVRSSSFTGMAGVFLPHGLDAGLARGSFRWDADYFDSYTSASVVIPLWPAVVMLSLATGTAWRLDTLARRRERLNHCPKCNYDRTGLAPGAVCPECGAGAGGAGVAGAAARGDGAAA